MSECKDFQDFCKDVADRIPDYLLQFHVDQVRIETITKNNGVNLTGLIVAIQESKVVPNVYLEYYYGRYQEGRSMEEILSEISREYRQMYNRLKADGITGDITEDAQKRIFIKLVNYEKNKEQLETVPFIPFFDMAITFRYLVRIDERGIASSLIRNRELEQLSMTVEELYEYAMVNTERLFPCEVRALDEIVRQTMCPEFSQEQDLGIYVLTNSHYINGATYLLFKDKLLDFAKEHGGDFFIVPSSIHELLLCPKRIGMEREFLEHILREANESVVSEMDFLSDSVLEFCLEDGLLHK